MTEDITVRLRPSDNLAVRLEAAAEIERLRHALRMAASRFDYLTGTLQGEDKIKVYYMARETYADLEGPADD